MKIRKLLILLLIFLVIIFFLTNFSSIYTIDDYAYVIAIGLDKSDESNILLSLQIAIPSGTSGNNKQSSSSQSSSSIVSSVKCKNIGDGINIINDYIGEKLNLSYCKAIIFSEDLAKNGIGNFICTATNDIELRPSCDIIISKCSANEFIQNSKPLLESLSSKYYKMVQVSQKDTGYTRAISLMSFYNKYYDTLSEPFAPISSIDFSNDKTSSNKSNNSEKSFNINSNNLNENNNLENIANFQDTSNNLNGNQINNSNLIADNNQTSNFESKNDSNSSNSSEKDVESDKSNPKIVNMGIAVFKDDKLIGEINKDEALSYMIVTGKLNNTILTIPSPFEDSDFISLNISDIKSKKRVQTNGNNPIINCNISLSARVLSSTKSANYLTKENILLIENSLNSYLTANITDFLYKTSKDLKSDFIGFGSFAIRNFTTMNQWKNYNWLDKYQNSNFNVNVSSSIKSSYLIIG